MPPPRLRGENLATLDIRLRDDLGTRYRWRGGSDTERQTQRIYQPGVPTDATMLTVQAANVAKRIIGTMTSRSPAERTSTPLPPCSTCRA
jgi:hypothetical protein